MSHADTRDWTRLARLQLRTARWRLTLWPVAIGVLVTSSALAVASFYPTVADRALYARTAGGSAVSVAFNGRGYGLDLIGGIVAFEIAIYALLVFPIVAIHLAIHLTRSQEDAGRLELLTAARLGRTGPMVAASVALAGVIASAGVLSVAGLVAAGLPTANAAVYMAGVTAHMAVFAAVGLLAAQVARDARGAHGLALAVLGVLFLVRALIDVRGWDLVWLTPGGWLAEVRAFDAPTAWPIIASWVLATALGGLAATMNVHRDMDGGLMSPRLGPAHGTARLGTALGLTGRLTRGLAVSWTVASVVWAFALGVASREMNELVEKNPALAQLFANAGDRPEDLMNAMAALFAAILAVGLGAQIVGRMAGEELAGRTGVVLATRLPRRAWWRAGLLTLGGQILVLMFLSGVALGAGVWIATGDGGYAMWAPIWLLAYLPAVLVLVAAVALVSALRPRLHGAGWVALGWVATVAFLGTTLRMPQTLKNTSPLELVGRLPADAVSGTALTVMAALALVLAAISIAAFRRRDLVR